MKIAILISGRGSNMLRIADLAAEHDDIADIVLIAANRPCEGLSAASERGLNTKLVERKAFDERRSHEVALADAIDNSGAEWVLLAGYIAILSPWFVERFSDRILNIHPSILPHLKGLDTHARALASGVKKHGATVHLVNAELDGGPIILQAGLDVKSHEDEATLAARVLQLEHALYPFVIMALSRGWLKIVNGAPVWRYGRQDLEGSESEFPDVLAESAIWPGEDRRDNL